MSALRYVPGMYVVDFGDRVKVGISGSLRDRLRRHAQAGAIRALAFPTLGDLLAMESAVVFVAERIGWRTGPRSESFTRLTFGQLCDLTSVAITHMQGGPVRQVEPDFAELLTVRPHVSVIMRERAAQRRQREAGAA